MKSKARKVRHFGKPATTSTSDRLIVTDETGAPWCSVGEADKSRGGRATNGDFLGKMASAVYCLHSRYFQGMKGHDLLLVQLCTLCREAGWMGPPIFSAVRPGEYPEIDPFILEELLSVDSFSAKTRQKQDVHPVVRNDRSEPSGRRTAINRVNVSFEDLYHILVEIAALVYPLDAVETNDSPSPRAMYRLLLDGVFPLVSEVAPRLCSPRYEKNREEMMSHASSIRLIIMCSNLAGAHNDLRLLIQVRRYVVF